MPVVQPDEVCCLSLYARTHELATHTVRHIPPCTVMHVLTDKGIDHYWP